MKIISVVGARPNFMKIAPFIREIEEYNKRSDNKINHILVHTGQHYDSRMSEKFFDDLGIPPANINLGIGSGSHAEQVGKTMIEFEKVLHKEQPDWVVVVGDVNATLACSVTAKKEKIKCCHIEAGLRSGDLEMPEEINRLVTDKLSDLLLTPDKMSSQILLNEGIADEKIKFVGNIMIDTLEYNRERAAKLTTHKILTENIIEDNVEKIKTLRLENYGIITMHRPSNVDDQSIMTALIDWIVDKACSKLSFIWPIHPRTIKQAKAFGLWEKIVGCSKLILLYPIGYLEMLNLNMQAQIMLTDSGGLQEECCVLGTPFLTLRWNTERPVTLLKNGGIGYLVGNNIDMIQKEFDQLIKKERNTRRPELWDGKTAQRVLTAIINYQKTNKIRLKSN